MQIETERQGDVAVIRFANPPGNALDGALCDGLMQAFQAALDADGVRGIVIAATGADFCTATVEDHMSPKLGALCEAIEGARRPVVAALHGAVLGDGLDLALACHGRVAAPGTRVGMPGVRRGLPPRAGATQRLPRLVGAGAALSLLLGGRDREPPQGLVDLGGVADPVAAAVDLLAKGAPLHPTDRRTEGFGDPAGYAAAVARARDATRGSPLIAPERIVTCVEGALLLPMSAGLEMERAAFDDAARSEASRALCHLALAEAQAWQIPEAAGGRARIMSRIAILGGTARAGELALSCLDAGCEVMLVELDSAGQAAVLERILALYDEAVAKGTLDADLRDARLLKIAPDAGLDDIGDADVVWEAAEDDPVLKRELWGAIGLFARPGAVLLSAGDVVPLAPLAEAGGRPEDTLGLHIPDPAHIAPLAEVVPLGAVSADAVTTALALLRRLERRAVRAEDRPGRVMHRLAETLERCIEALLVGGLRAEDVDLALTTYGFRAAPCAGLDARGLDRVLAHRRAVAGQGAEGAPEVALLDALVDSGLTGRAAGAGLLSWRDGVAAGEHPEARALMQALAEATNVAPKRLRGPEIAWTCAAALANEGARMLETGAVLRPGDIDVAAVHGLGFPRWRGGPMMAADLRGLVSVERDLARFGTEPSPLFSELIKNGASFHGLDGPQGG